MLNDIFKKDSTFLREALVWGAGFGMQSEARSKIVKQPTFEVKTLSCKIRGLGLSWGSHYVMCFGVRDAISLNEKRARSAE